MTNRNWTPSPPPSSLSFHASPPVPILSSLLLHFLRPPRYLPPSHPPTSCLPPLFPILYFICLSTPSSYPLLTILLLPFHRLILLLLILHFPLLRLPHVSPLHPCSLFPAFSSFSLFFLFFSYSYFPSLTCMLLLWWTKHLFTVSCNSR